MTTPDACAGVEVRLVRRLPAHPARLRGRAARAWPSRCRSPTSWRRSSAVVAGPVRRVAGRGVDHHAEPTPSASGGSASSPRILVTIGACATAGGIQALRNFADVDEFRSVVYARPEYIETLATSTPIAAHVPVDYELRGCPIDRRQLLEVHHRAAGRPQARTSRRTASASSASCAATSASSWRTGTPCLGPVTHAGCGALCPAYGRGCYGCFGPMATPNTAALAGLLRATGMSDARRRRGSTARSTPPRRLPDRRSPRGRPAREATHDATATTGRSTSARWPGSRARARCTSACAAAGQRRAAGDLRAAAVLRGVPARPRAHRAAGHHRPHLRHLPGRLPDERLPGHRGRLRRDRRPSRSPTCAGCSTAASGSPATPCTSTCCTRPDFLGYPERGRAGHGPPGHRRARPGAEEGRQRHPRDCSAAGPSTRSTCGSAASTARPTRAELAALAETLRRALDDALATVRLGGRASTSPTSTTTTSCSPWSSPAGTPSRPARRAPTAGSTFPVARLRASTSSRSRCRTPPPCTPAWPAAAAT